jgi:hypothetical protein
MAEIKSAARSAEKWKRQSAAARPEYEQGVRDTKKDWKDNTLRGAQNYEQAVTKAIADKRFQGGVDKAGTATWREATLSKGPNRWTEGIAGSTDKYERGFAPYRATIEGLTLPPRGPKGSPQNIDRVRAVTEALHNTKQELNR